MADMSAEIQQSTSSVSDSYRFAVANPDALKNVPCYCGCVAVGHTSNYSCYVKEIKPSGEIVFDQHALNCGICVDITLDVMKMTGEGKIPKDIRAAIDQRYAQFGPSNMPPVQYGQWISNQEMGEGLFSPPDFTDPKNLLGTSPALLEGKIIRGGMGSGMPYWDPIFTPQQIDVLVGYLYSFAWGKP